MEGRTVSLIITTVDPTPQPVLMSTAGTLPLYLYPIINDPLNQNHVRRDRKEIYSHDVWSNLIEKIYIATRLFNSQALGRLSLSVQACSLCPILVTCNKSLQMTVSQSYLVYLQSITTLTINIVLCIVRSRNSEQAYLHLYQRKFVIKFYRSILKSLRSRFDE